MADVAISGLPAVTSLADASVLPVVQEGVTSKVTIENVRNAMLDGRPVVLLPPSPMPSPPPAGAMLFGRSVAGRIMPAFMGPSGLDTAVQSFLFRNKVALWSPAGNGTAVSLIGCAAMTATGTATQVVVAITNRYTWQKRIEYLATTAAPNAVAGWRYPALQWGLGNGAGHGGFTYVQRFGLATGVTGSSYRLFVGMQGITTAPTDVNPSTLTNMVGVGLDSTDPYFFIMCNSASGAVTRVGIPWMLRPSGDRTATYEVAIFCPPNATWVGVQLTDLTTGDTAYQTFGSNLPASTQLLAPRAYMSAGGTSNVVGLAFMLAGIETDY